MGRDVTENALAQDPTCKMANTKILRNEPRQQNVVNNASKHNFQ